MDILVANQDWIPWVFSGIGIAVIGLLWQIAKFIYVAKWKRTRPEESATSQRPFQRNRQAMLKQVHDFWVKGVLENSLYGGALLELGMAERKEAVDRPWDIVLQIPGQDNRRLPPGTKIVDVFDQMGRSLLILGEPGSGKTTILLDLARDTITRTIKNPEQPIPVVFNLSSWAGKKKPIAEWLVEELNVKYNIPKKIAQPWVENDELLLLLDGLDEVAPDRREACVGAINDFRQKHLVPLVVCSRIEEYELLTSQLKLQGAVVLQPLTPQQVDEYLEGAGDEMLVIRQTLQDDDELQELLTSPLILSIFILASKGISAQKLRHLKGVKIRRNYLFETYIDQMLKRRGANQSYSPEQTIRWLRWLAQRMAQYSQTVFLIEQIQPSWLSNLIQLLTYIFVSRLVAAFTAGAILVPIEVVSETDLMEGIYAWLLFGIVGGVGLGIIDSLRFREILKLISEGWQAVYTISTVILLFGLIGVRLEPDNPWWSTFLLWGTIFGLLFGLKRMRRGLSDDIQSVESVSWSWMNSLRVGGGGLIIGFLIAVLLGFEKVIYAGMFFGLLGAIYGGLQSQTLSARSRPNQGIRLSIGNAIIYGVGLGGFIALIVNFIGDTATMTLLIGSLVIFGLPISLWFGGFEVINHYTLRLLLYFGGDANLNYVRFLDYASSLILLQKVGDGGGYIFKHSLLQTYFVNISEKGDVNNE